MPSAFTWTVRVYYANYLKFFERARTEWLRHADVGQHALREAHAALFVVKHCSIDYHAPAVLDDVIQLTISIEKLGRASVQFVQQAWRGATLLTSAHVKVGCVDAATLKPRAIPDDTAARMLAA